MFLVHSAIVFDFQWIKVYRTSQTYTKRKQYKQPFNTSIGIGSWVIPEAGQYGQIRRQYEDMSPTLGSYACIFGAFTNTAKERFRLADAKRIAGDFRGRIQAVKINESEGSGS